MNKLIYKVALQLNSPEPHQRFRKYLEQHGVVREVVNTAAEILPLISDGRKSIEFGVNAYKDVIITISPCLDIKVQISESYCALFCKDELISQMSLQRFNKDFFIVDLVQAYQIAADTTLAE